MRLQSWPASLVTSGAFLLVLGACADAPGSHDELGTLPGKSTGSSASNSAGTSSSSSAGTTSNAGAAASGSGGMPGGSAGSGALPQAATPKWQCWEWHTTADNTLEFYIDGELYAPMSVTAADKWPFPIFKKLYLGFMQFGTTPATELWIDEVVLSDARVGCGN